MSSSEPEWSEEQVCKTFMDAMKHYDELSQSFKQIGKGTDIR
ncbi:MAG: hypothetical protein P4M11_03115 [Candidatus Pacebacteria bacterium]|nr:hypothetical protein [Candidatus Paceibacterota bacterium]